MFPKTSSRGDIVNPCSASLALAVTRPCFSALGYLKTAHTASAMPFPFTSTIA